MQILLVKLIFMHNRRIFPDLKAHLTQKQITVITGMRRVGKSTALKYLLDQVPHSNKVYLDLERVEHRFTFQQLTYRDVQIDLEIAGIDFSKPAVIALDELQLVKEITSVIKWLYDTYPDLKFIVTGSSSFYLKNHFSESLAGRKHVFEMYPLDFIEFLQFRGENTSVLESLVLQPLQQGAYLKYKDLYEEYLQYGGFPDVVLTTDLKYKALTIKDVINSYIDLDVRLVADFEVSGTLYKLIRLLAGQSGSLIDVTNISSVLGVELRKVKGYIELLEKTYFIHIVHPYSRNLESELRTRKKVYLADTGLLSVLGKVSSGQVFENAIYLQLLKRYQQVQFYQRKAGQEIDFIVQTDMACEVKETPNQNDLNTLIRRATSVNMQKHLLIGRHLPGNQWKDFVWAGQVF
jgi:uncharacterized protein